MPLVKDLEARNMDHFMELWIVHKEGFNLYVKGKSEFQTVTETLIDLRLKAIWTS